MSQIIANAGPGQLKILMTDGSTYEVATEEYVDIEQNHRGQFVRILRRGRIVGDVLVWKDADDPRIS